MKLIAHRGNINGPNPKVENHPDYIQNALNKGYDVEVDIWYIKKNSQLFFGHDEPKYPIELTENLINNDKIWWHTKNLEALEYCINIGPNIIPNFFWHQEDDFTITSNGYIWTYPNKHLTKHSICVLPEIFNQKVPKYVAGICSDYISDYH